MGVKYDLVLVPRSQFFEYLRETLYKHMPWSTWKRPVQKKKKINIIFLRKRLLLISLKACNWSGQIFGASASPSSLTKKLAVSPLPLLLMAVSMIPNTECVTIELLLHAAFVADQIRGDTLEPARISTVPVYPVLWRAAGRLSEHNQNGYK